MSCETCGDRRYLHIDYDGTDMPEIERCDACSFPELDDDNACILHRLYCGCDVPEISEGRRGTEGDLVSVGTMMPFPTFGPEYDDTMERLKTYGMTVNKTREAL